MFLYRYTFFAFLLLVSTALTAQDISGYVSAENGNSVSYASIYLKNKNIGLITDSTGMYKLPNSVLEEIEDTLLFSCIGYYSEKIPVSLFKNYVLTGNTNILLKTNSILLQEVIVKPSTDKAKEYGLFKLQSANFLLTGKPSSKIMVFVENTDKINRIIKTVNIKIKKNDDKTKKLRIFFCQKTNDGFQNINITNDEIIISDFSKSKIQADVSKYQILFGENGIYVGVEWISTENSIQNRSEKIGLSVVCTAKSKKSFTWICENEIWKQFPDLTENEWHSIPKIFRNIVMNANAQIGITTY